MSSSADGKLLAVTSLLGIVRIYETKDWQLIQELRDAKVLFPDINALIMVGNAH